MRASFGSTLNIAKGYPNDVSLININRLSTNVTNLISFVVTLMFQEPIPGWTNAEAASSRRPEERRLQRAAIAHLQAIAALPAGYLHHSGRHAMALDADVLHPELFLVLAGLRGDLVGDGISF